MVDCMTTPPTPALPGPPNLLKSIRAGFDAVANHATLLVIPVLLDLLFWLGPHIQIKRLLQGLLSNLASSSSFNTAESGSLLAENLDLLNQAAGRLSSQPVSGS